MKNKSILITGASGSIGFAISKNIIENGYELWIMLFLL